MPFYKVCPQCGRVCNSWEDYCFSCHDFLIVEWFGIHMNDYRTNEHICEVKDNEIIKCGQLIGYVGTVLNLEKITNNSPKYIQEIKKNGSPSMLHLEVYRSKPSARKKYLGGNWFGTKKPDNLINPAFHL